MNTFILLFCFFSEPYLEVIPNSPRISYQAGSSCASALDNTNDIIIILEKEYNREVVSICSPVISYEGIHE